MASTQGSRENFARLGMAIIDEETKILRRILECEVGPSKIEQEVKKAKNLRLTDCQKDLLKTVSSTLDYSKCDITLLYTLIRNTCTNVYQPTNGWGKNPSVTETKVGDDVERIRLIRNEVYGHVSTTWMSDADFQSHWNTINDVCVRMDQYFLSKNILTQFESELKEIKNRSLDEKTQEKYIEKIKEMEEIKKQQEENIKQLKKYIVHTIARGGRVCKKYMELNLTNKFERELTVKLTDSYLQDLGALINGVEKFINIDSMIEECTQITKSVFSEGLAVTKRKYHDVLSKLQESFQKFKGLLCPLQQDQEINMLIDVLLFVMSLKKYECILNSDCFGESFVMCFVFSSTHPPGSLTCLGIDVALRDLILREEYLSIYNLPNGLILNVNEIDEMAFNELQERKGRKRKFGCDDDEKMEDLNNDEVEDDCVNMSTENNEIQLKVDSLGKMVEDIRFLSDEENDKMDTGEKRGLNLKSFQEELTEIAKNGNNTIVCSETGTGKTRIAFAIIQDHLKKKPKGRVGILANSTLLVEQHYKTFLSLLPEFEDSSIKLTGDNKHSKNLHLFVKDIPIIIMTPALIMNTIEKGRDPSILSRFTLLVFDECHHTYGDHDFNKVMRQYHMDRDQRNEIPQILGLTATLGTKSADSTEKAKSHILEIMANLDVEELSTVIREKDDYQSSVKDVKTEIIQLEKSKTNDPVGEVLQNFMEKLEEKVYSLKGNLSSDDCEEDNMLIVINGFPGHEKRNSSSEYITWCRRLYDSAIHLMGKNLELANEIKLYAKYLQIFCESLEINDCIRGENSILALKDKLEQENFHLPSQNQCEDELAKKAVATSQTEQKRIKAKLDACEIQGIVATDIAGEGLNLINCRCVIRYKCAGNEISSRQMKGRVRSENGACINLGERHHSMRERLNMWRILRMIEAMNEIVVKMNKKELKETLDDLRKKIVLQEKRRQKMEKESNLKKEECSKYALSCKHCGKFDINCENIFVISGKHHVVIDTTIWDRIIQKPLKKKAYIDVNDGLQQDMEWYHHNCRVKMGTVYVFKGVRLPFLSQEKFVYYRKKDDPRIPEPVRKWKLVPFENSLREVGQEQLTQMTGVL